MSHPALFRALQSSSLARVGAGAGAGADRGPPLFDGEVLTRHTERFSEKYHFGDKAKREEGGKDKGEPDSKRKKKEPFKKGGDGDGDGKKNEAKKRDRNSDGDDSDSWDDEVLLTPPAARRPPPAARRSRHAPPQDGDGKPNKVDKDKKKAQTEKK